MLKNFIKYQALGNDFIIFDWYKKPAVFVQSELTMPLWSDFVKLACNRHLGVGADGVLVITSDNQLGMPEILIFNADGSRAESCFNGLRCVADFLSVTYHFPPLFHIKMGHRIIDCVVNAVVGQDRDITTNVGPVVYEGDKTVAIDQASFEGCVVNVGNPHFIIFKQTTLDWLSLYGRFLESHEQFPARTNVEFVWPITTTFASITKNRSYAMLVYERGCGITFSCSSGAAAVIGLLYKQNQIKIQEKIDICMPGGFVTGWVDEKESVFLAGHATLVFTASFESEAPLKYDQKSTNIFFPSM